MKKTIIYLICLICSVAITAQGFIASSITKELDRKLKTRTVEEVKTWFKAAKDSSQYKVDIGEMADLAYDLMMQDDAENALEVLKLNVLAFPENPNVYNERIICSAASQLQSFGYEELAKQYLDLNSEVNPNSERSLRGYGDFYMKSGNQKLAVEYHTKAAKVNPVGNLFQIVFKASNTYLPTEIPSDTVSLFESRGNEDGSIAFIFVQGGPDIKLNIHDRDPLHLMNLPDSVQKVYPYQAAMLNPDFLVSMPTITPEQGEYENLVSAEILHRIISFLRGQGKQVYLIGHSYGATICLEYMVKYNYDDVERIVLMGKDLDEDMRNYEGMEPGKFIRWKNGTEPYLRNFYRGVPDDFPVKHKLNAVLDNITCMQIVHCEKRFTELLKDKDMSNVVFMHARFDEANGRSSEEELKILKSRKVKTVETFGDHHSMFSAEIMVNLFDHLMEGKMLKQSLAARIDRQLDNSDSISLEDTINDKKFLVSERELNFLGYKLMEVGKLEQAIDVFKMNTISFPNSSNVFDSLGEAYLESGNTQLAMKNYSKAYELDPGNINAKQIMERLEKGEAR